MDSTNNRNLDIIIYDWCYNELYRGGCDSDECDEVLLVNKCNCDEGCTNCDHTGYLGDIFIQWVDEDNNSDLNVYEYTSY